MSYQINLGQWNSVFAVPAALVDKHIKLATEAQLKVILYLLRHSGEVLSEQSLSDALSISVQEVKNAMDFWVERRLLAQSGEELTPTSSLPSGKPKRLRSTPPYHALFAPIVHLLPRQYKRIRILSACWTKHRRLSESRFHRVTPPPL